MKQKTAHGKAIWGVVLAAVLLIAAWVLWPRSLAGLLDASTELRVTLSSQQGELLVEPGTPEMEAVQTVLERYSYRMRWSAIPGLDVFLDERLSEGGLNVTLKDAKGGGFHFGDAGSEFCCFPSARLACLKGQAATGSALRGELMAALDIH